MKLMASADGRDIVFFDRGNCKTWIDPLFEISDEIRKQATRCELGEAPQLAAIRARRLKCK